MGSTVAQSTPTVADGWPSRWPPAQDADGPERLLASGPSLKANGRIRPRDHWDDLRRLASSIRTGVVSAAVMLRRLGA
jgi:TnpA family transposase